ncbi:hypothetical protein HRbin23_00415 [bacterium HR23]|nr:hypothetical protein HRbin23_00415 [bacterium HR23]
MTRETTPEELTPRTPLWQAVALLGGAVAGALATAVVVPLWVPSLAGSLAGPQGHGYWYLSRVSGLVAYGLLWLSTVLGLLLTGRIARTWPGVPTAVDLHQFLSLVALAFSLLHALVLLGDRYAGYTPFTLLVPFASSPYRPLWVAWGQIGLYLTAVVTFSFYFRKRIGPRTWRRLHYLTFLVYSMVLVHAVVAGTDTPNPVVVLYYLVTGGAVYALTLFRLLIRSVDVGRQPTHAPNPSHGAGQTHHLAG